MRQNNFDIVRLVLAAVVVLVHTSTLSHSGVLRPLHWLSATVAVEGFFAISGFLIFASYERCQSLGEYARNRAWRILPGYWFSAAVCVLIAVSQGYFHFLPWLAADLSFAGFLRDTIPGLFAQNPDGAAVNGALWTIKIEVMFYVSVPLIVWLCRRLKRDAVLWTLFVLSIVFRIVLWKSRFGLQLPGELSYFMIGALVYYHLAWFKRHGAWLMLGAAAVFALHLATGWYALRPAPVALLTMGACLLLPPFKGPTRWGDFSYGTYILHYPIVQCLVAAGAFAWSGWLGLGATLVLVTGAAIFSWFVIERPSLAHAKSRRLRQSAFGAAPNFPPAVP